MGFEVIYTYHERLEEGGYNKEEDKEMKRRIGDPFEDVPLEKVAAAVMKQLVRRDIWVTNWDVYEYKKQKLNCRETKGAIIIKNKKFALDGDGVGTIVAEDIEVPLNGALTGAPFTPGVLPHNNLPVPQQPQPGVMRRPIKWVVLDTDDMTVAKVKGAGLQFSPNKRYPVFQEMPDPRDKRVDKFGNPSLERKMVLVMWDDHSREVQVSADFFVSADIQLLGGNFNRPSDAPRLMFEGERAEDMPDIRGRR